MLRGRIDPRIFVLISILVVVGLILSIVGGVSVYSATNQPPSSSAIGYLHDGAIILIVAFAILVFACLYTFIYIRETIKTDRVLLYAAAASLPFLLVRDLYNILQAFRVDTYLFNSSMGSVAVYGVMAILMEFIVVILYLAAGWQAPKIDRGQVQMGIWLSMQQGGRGPGQGQGQAFPRESNPSTPNRACAHRSSERLPPASRGTRIRIRTTCLSRLSTKWKVNGTSYIRCIRGHRRRRCG